MTARRTLPALLILLAFLGAGELVARRWLVAPFGTTLDATFGFIQRPGSAVVQSAEGWGSYTANSDGFLDREFSVAPPAARALLMGDSFTQGLQVCYGERYSEVTEQLVPGLDVLNVGTGGRSPIDYALFMPRFQAAFHPALTIVQVDDVNLTDVESPALWVKAREEFNAEGAVAAHERSSRAGAVGFLRLLARRSSLVTLLRSRMQLLARQEHARLGRKLGLLHPDLEDVVARRPTPRAEALIDSLIMEVARVNPHLILVYVPDFFYFDAVPHVAYPMREAWYHVLAAQRGIVLVDPVDRMLAEFRRTGEPMHGFLDTRPGEGHLNARGHRIIGELLAAAIRRQAGPGGPWAAPGGTPSSATPGAPGEPAARATARTGPGARP